MLTIALIRPGESEYDRQGRVQGNLDVPLSPEGMRQVERIAQELGEADLEILYGSPSEPAWETTERLAAQLGVKAKPLDDLRSLDHGLWQGLLIDEVKRKHPRVFRQWEDSPESICPPEGESLVEARQRVQACMTRLIKKQREGRIGLVVPEPVSMLVRSCFGPVEMRGLWLGVSDRPAWEWIEAGPLVTAPR